MPTYQYACTNPECGNKFERVQAFTDDAISQCPVCGQRVRKVYGSVGVVFKGSGFYRNDSRESSTGGDGPVKTSSDGSDSKTGETKPAGNEPAEGSKKTSDTKSDGGPASTPPAKSTAGSATASPASGGSSGTKPASSTSSTSS